MPPYGLFFCFILRELFANMQIAFASMQHPFAT